MLFFESRNRKYSPRNGTCPPSGRRRGQRRRSRVEVIGIREGPKEVVVETTQGEFKTDFVIVCAGLHADRMAALCGIDLDFRIVPFRGEYFRLRDSKNNIVKHLIYPVPDPRLPFLGVHLTPMIGGYVTVGPNAVLAMAREGYRRSAIDLKELAGLLAFPGFWRLMRDHAASALIELKNSLWRAGYLAECQKFCPELTLNDLSPYPAGVRAQAVLRDGTLMHDFAIRRTKRTLHVCNAPSPAATSAMPIGRHLVDQMVQGFDMGKIKMSRSDEQTVHAFGPMADDDGDSPRPPLKLDEKLPTSRTPMWVSPRPNGHR